jgi:hypothetical protein
LWVAADAGFVVKKIGRPDDSYTERHPGSPGCDRWTRFLDDLEKSGLLKELYRNRDKRFCRTSCALQEFDSAVAFSRRPGEDP